MDDQLIEKVARALEQVGEAYTVSSGKNNRGERGFYVRRRDDCGDDFEAVAGPFKTDREADAEIQRIIARAAIEAYEKAKRTADALSDLAEIDADLI